LHRPAFRRALKTVDTIVFDLIADRRKQAAPPDDLLTQLLAARDASDPELSDQELRDAAVTLLLAGHETTANALAWAFYEMAGHPEITPQTTNPAHIFAETVRLYPSIWIVERRVYIPYGLGPHRCIGLHMAQAIGAEVLRQVFAQFTLHRAGPAVSLDPKITLRPDGPLLLQVAAL